MTTLRTRRILVPVIGPFGAPTTNPQSAFPVGLSPAQTTSGVTPFSEQAVPLTQFELANRGAPTAVLESARRATPRFAAPGSPAERAVHAAEQLGSGPALAKGFLEFPGATLRGESTPFMQRRDQLIAQGLTRPDASTVAARETTSLPWGVGTLTDVVADPTNLLPVPFAGEVAGFGARLAGEAAAPALRAGARLGGTAVRAGREVAEAAAPVARRLAAGETGAFGYPGLEWEKLRAAELEAIRENPATWAKARPDRQAEIVREITELRRRIAAERVYKYPTVQDKNRNRAAARTISLEERPYGLGHSGRRIAEPPPAPDFLTLRGVDAELSRLKDAITIAARNKADTAALQEAHDSLGVYRRNLLEGQLSEPWLARLKDLEEQVLNDSAELDAAREALRSHPAAQYDKKLVQRFGPNKGEVVSDATARKVAGQHFDELAQSLGYEGGNVPAIGRRPTYEMMADERFKHDLQEAARMRSSLVARERSLADAQRELNALLKGVERAPTPEIQVGELVGKSVAPRAAATAPTPPTVPVPEQAGALQAGLGIGERPAQGQLLGEFQGRAQPSVPLIDAEQQAARAASREAVAQGQAVLPGTPPAVRAAAQAATPTPPAAVGQPPAAALPSHPAAPPGGSIPPPLGGTPPPPTGGVPPGIGGQPPSWESARDKLLTNIKAAKPARAETEALYTAERQRRVAIGAEALESGRGTEAFRRAQASQAGTLPRARFELPEGLTAGEIDVLVERIRTFNALRFYEKLNTNTALTRLLAGDIPGEHELQLLQKVFGSDLVKAILDKRKFGQKALDEALDAINVPRALMSSADISAPLRQGAILSAGHPLIAGKNFGVMLKAMAKDSYAEAVQDAIHAAPFASVREEAGLYLADIVNVAQRAGTAEEAFMLSAERTFTSRLLRKLPHVRLSERAYVTFLNKMRADVFDHVYGGWDATMRTPQNARDLARFINYATGRGPLPGNEAAAMLNATFFAPRLVTSRLLLPGYSVKMMANPALRKEVARDIIAFVGTGLSVLGLLKLTLGDDAVEDDPHSPDFGRVKLGPTRIDFWAGFQPIARYATQVTTGRAKELPERGASHYEINRAERLLRFVRSKFAPSVSLGADVLSGRTYSGEEVEFTGGTAARLAYQNTVPLFVQDLVDAAQADGSPLGATKALGSAVGTGSYSVKQDAMMRYWGAVENEVPPALKPKWDQYWEFPARDRQAYLRSLPREDAAAIFGFVNKQKYLRLQMRRNDPELDAALVEEGRAPKTEQGKRRLEELRREQGIGQSSPTSTTPAAPAPVTPPIQRPVPIAPKPMTPAQAFPTGPARRPVPAGAAGGAFFR